MSGPVKSPSGTPRRYHSPRRAEQAAGTRRAILDATRELLSLQGYTATTVSHIAARADVAVDTVYSAVGRKPALLRALIETAISGTDEAVPAERRDYVARIRAAATAHEKITVYAAALVQIQSRLAPVHLAVREAAAADPDCAALWCEIAERRAVNMRLFIADLRTTGAVRDDLDDDTLADIVWSMNSAEFWTLLTHDRGWEAHRVGEFIADAWVRLLLAPPTGRSRTRRPTPLVGPASDES